MEVMTLYFSTERKLNVLKEEFNSYIGDDMEQDNYDYHKKTVSFIQYFSFGYFDFSKINNMGR